MHVLLSMLIPSGREHISGTHFPNQPGLPGLRTSQQSATRLINPGCDLSYFKEKSQANRYKYLFFLAELFQLPH